MGGAYTMFQKWTPFHGPELKKTCKKNGIDYFTAPYDLNIINYLNKHVAAWKVGSGDITFHENIIKLAKTKKVIIVATGAANLYEIKKIYKKLIKINKKIIIMQCNTNYTADKKNFYHINLRVLNKYKKLFPEAILGLSDLHSNKTVLGAVLWGTCWKHFTDDNNKWRIIIFHESYNLENMVLSTRNLEMSLEMD